MNLTIILLAAATLALAVCGLVLSRRVDRLENECSSYIHGLLELKKRLEVVEEAAKLLNENAKALDKRLDKFEFAVQSAESEVDFTAGVGAILSYDAFDALQEAKKEHGDA